MTDDARLLVLKSYIEKGNILKKNPTVEIISKNINELLMNSARAKSTPSLFYFLESSSGAGKSQLCEALSMPVIYIPLTTAQMIYSCFIDLSDLVLSAVASDYSKLDPDEKKSATKLMKAKKFKSHTAALLVELIKLTHGKTNEESLRLLSGSAGKLKLEYVPLSFDDARESITEFTKESIAYNAFPLIFIDEVPSKKDLVQYERCILLRNIIRGMQCVALLCGTEAAAMNAIDSVSSGSRTDSNPEYVRLIVKLPATDWNVFASDTKYAGIIPRLSDHLLQLLQRTKPLFAEWLLDEILATPGNSTNKIELTVAMLKAAKNKIIQRKESFSSDEGLFGQVAIMHQAFLSRKVDESHKRKRDQIDKPATQYYFNDLQRFCIRHHFAIMDCSSVANGVFIPLYVGSDGKLFYKTTTMKEVFFSPQVIFQPPCVDPLLYLICIRDGLHCQHGNRRSVRVSTTFALSKRFALQNGENPVLLGNINAQSCSGKFLELEVVTGSIVASHAYDCLNGCPLPHYVRLLISELSPYAPYELISEVTGMPASFSNIFSGLLSSANTSWVSSSSASSSSSNATYLAENDLFLCNFVWSPNKDRNDGAMPVKLMSGDGVQMLKLTEEVKCYAKNVTGNIIAKTGVNHLSVNGVAVTLVVVTKLGELSLTDADFTNAYKTGDKWNCNLVKIVGNSTPDVCVATTLNWVPIIPYDEALTTVIIIVLETIYHGRYEMMQSAYKST